jgi:hypothetical protein
MGLAINLGGSELMEPEQFLDDLAQINHVLAENGLPLHAEPAAPLRARMRADMTSIAYSTLHALRRLQAHALQDPSWKPTPCSDDYDPAQDEAIDRELTVHLRSHLILHSDCEGYYVPVDFPDVLYGAPGGDMLGSSQRLLEELQKLAPLVGVTLERGRLSDGEAQRLNRELGDVDPFWREKAAWLLLFEAARLSVELRTSAARRRKRRESSRRASRPAESCPTYGASPDRSLPPPAPAARVRRAPD